MLNEQTRHAISPTAHVFGQAYYDQNIKTPNSFEMNPSFQDEQNMSPKESENSKCFEDLGI